VEITEDEAELARIWDRDEQTRDIAEEALEALLEHVDLEAPTWSRRRVLDVGCGTGLLTAALAPFVGEVVAVDMSPARIALLRDKRIANVEARCADIDGDNPPWFGSFDLVVASCVCGALPSYPTTMRRLARALRSGGVFAQWDWLLDDPDTDGDGLTLASVASAFEASGLTRVYIDHAFDSLFDGEPLLMGVALKMVIAL
jgi:SAM-dependent methyltransferase